MFIALAMALVALALSLGACGGDDNEGEAATTSAPATQPPLGGGATPPSSASQLPPQFVKCMAEQGYDVQSSADIHSAPTAVLQLCFGALHGSGG
jgi:hypothetical protein